MHSGNTIIIAGTTCALVALTWGGVQFPWSSAHVLGPLIVGFVFIGLFFLYEFFVPKEFVDAVGKSLDIASGNPQQFESQVPVSILKHCESSYVAADGSREKTSGDVFDDTGLMALVCRHDIPLYLCNIDTPGEQQKYFISLVIWFLLHLPDNATVATFYDINCVTWRMLAAV